MLLDPQAFAEVVERLQLRAEVRRESILAAGAVEAGASALSAAPPRTARPSNKVRFIMVMMISNTTAMPRVVTATSR